MPQTTHASDSRLYKCTNDKWSNAGLFRYHELKYSRKKNIITMISNDRPIINIFIFKAAQENNLPLVKYLIRMGANVNLRANDGMNVIHVSCQNGNLDLVDLLVNIEYLVTFCNKNN